MPVGIDEHSRVSAPKGLRAPPTDGRAGGLGFREDGVDLVGRRDVVRERDAAPAPGVVDRAVLGELVAAPEREDHAARLKEHDIAIRRFAGPSERLVEATGATDVRDTQCHHRHARLHVTSLAPASAGPLPRGPDPLPPPSPPPAWWHEPCVLDGAPAAPPPRP